MKKLYYIPGTISLVFLPLLFIPELINKIHKANDQQCIEINMPSLKKLESNKYEWWIIPKRKFTTIVCDKNMATNAIKIDNGFKQVRQIILSKDTVNAVQFTIKNAYYNDLISILNNCRKVNVKHYAYENDTVKILFKQPVIVKKETKIFLICGTSDMNYITHLEEVEKEHTEFIKTFTKNDRLFYIVCIIAGFLVLAVVSIRHITLNYKRKVL
ncbi:MAG: hypothetical protein ABL940_05135 [Bacteroidia bacterium]